MAAVVDMKFDLPVKLSPLVAAAAAPKCPRSLSANPAQLAGRMSGLLLLLGSWSCACVLSFSASSKNTRVDIVSCWAAASCSLTCRPAWPLMFSVYVVALLVTTPGRRTAPWRDPAPELP